MRVAFPPSLRILAGLLLAALLSVIGYRVFLRVSHSPRAMLVKADNLSWLNSWIAAAPIYHDAELGFKERGDSARALYAHVSQIPAQSESSTTIPNQIATLRMDLDRPEARDPETRLRILTILGMLETNYDAGMARQTWAEVKSLAVERHQFLLASRAVGEEGIAAFLLGDIATARKNVAQAWLVAKFADPGARIRYASMYGTGLVELHKFKEANGPLDEAIRVAASTPNAAYPSIAVDAKIEALSGTGRNAEALALADDAMQKVASLHLAGHLYELLQARARVYGNMNNWNQAVADLRGAAEDAKRLSYWRGVTQAEGLLAEAYLHTGDTHSALTAVNEAIAANKRIPDELYFVPSNLAIKAQILARLGDVKASNEFYEQSADMLDALLSRAPTPTVERQLLSELSNVYAGYFASLCNQGRTPDAFRTLERARGRVEAQGLSHHEVVVPHQPTPVDLRITELNVRLLDTPDPSQRATILDQIYSTERELDGSKASGVPSPVSLAALQRELQPSDLFIEYVLDEPVSYALAVTSTTVHRYELQARTEIEEDSDRYRSELVKRKTDTTLAANLYDELLAPIPEYKQKTNLIVVPDGKLHLLPLSSLMASGQYVLASHVVSVVPSGSVLDLLRHRHLPSPHDDMPYVGVAAWTSNPPSPNLLASIRRAVSGPNRQDLVALPESRREVETIADDLPKPSTILLGGHATKAAFRELPLNEYRVIHLALHGYADPEYPDRSALVFAPHASSTDDGLLQVREIRTLPLNTDLVTLSACDTGLVPVSEEGVDNIVNAFIEAGAQSVVSTLWDVEDHATAQLMISFTDSWACANPRQKHYAMRNSNC